MPSSYKSKVIAVGSHTSVKQAFFKSCEQEFSSCCDTSYWTIGLSIKIIEYSNEDEDSITIALWDINSGERFQFLFPNFLRGASGCLLFLDYSKDQLLSDLNNWLNLIRENTDMDIPIFIVGSSTDLKKRGDYIDILNFVENNNLDGFYLISTKNRSRDSIILNHISRKVLENIKLRPCNFSLENEFNTGKRTPYQEFIDFFSFCPICGKENHESYLKKFYFDHNLNSRMLREKLLLLMDKSKRFEQIYENEIKIGIPCCSCFEKLFS
ncbi:MAG: hypothetical protein ACFFDK_05395 [Promethearchaeota archaeon]